MKYTLLFILSLVALPLSAQTIAQQSIAGCQLLPSDHIYNTRVDSLPVDSNSAAWITAINASRIQYQYGLPINYVSTSTPTQAMSFYYTPLNNASFYVPQYPFAEIENGWFTAPLDGFDRHFLTVDPSTCNFQEMYDYYTVGTNTNCSGCTSQSGVQYAYNSYALPSNGSVDAAGLYVMPLMFRLQEWESGSINHALRMTLSLGECASSNIWPAQTFASDGGTVPFGARFRLKSTYDISGFSALAQVLLAQLKEYGIILADGGTNFAVSGGEYTKWPPAYLNALAEVQNANIASSNFEAVDESSLMQSATSGATSGSSAPTGTGLNVKQDEIYFQAGAPQTQLLAYSGGSTSGITWSASPTVGTLTSSGLYTPPTTETSPTVTTVTATDSSLGLSVTMRLTVLPNGPIRLYSCSVSANTECATNYTDANSHTWFPLTGDYGGYPYNNGGTWPPTPDITLYKIPYYAFGNDMRFDIYVPNGAYAITGKFASTNLSSCLPSQTLDIEAQGSIAYTGVNICSASGGNNKPIDYFLRTAVLSNLLSFVIRRITGSYNDISALEIDPVVVSINNANLRNVVIP